MQGNAHFSAYQWQCTCEYCGQYLIKLPFLKFANIITPLSFQYNKWKKNTMSEKINVMISFVTCLCPMFDHCIPGYIYLSLSNVWSLYTWLYLPVPVQCLIIVYLVIFTNVWSLYTWLYLPVRVSFVTCLFPMFDHCIPGYIYLLGLALLPVSVQCLIIVYLAIFTC